MSDTQEWDCAYECAVEGGEGTGKENDEEYGNMSISRQRSCPASACMQSNKLLGLTYSWLLLAGSSSALNGFCGHATTQPQYAGCIQMQSCHWLMLIGKLPATWPYHSLPSVGSNACTVPEPA